MSHNYNNDISKNNKVVNWPHFSQFAIKSSHAHCYLVFSWMKDVYRDFGLAGYSSSNP